MNSVYIYHHLGLGDHIIANGMVRTIAKNYQQLYLFCKPHNFFNVSYMYRDLKKLKIIIMNDMEVRQFIYMNPQNKYIIAGHENFLKIIKSNSALKIDEIFYQLADVPFENKWKEFYIERDIEKEKKVFKELNLSLKNSYSFIHDKIDNAIIKNISHIKKIVKPINTNVGIFDFLYTIENAEEIHCVNSSFYCLIDCIGIKRSKMFLHQYSNNSGDAELGLMKSPWIIIR